MPAFEYKVVPAPAKGTKAKGIKTPEARFANSVEITLNEMAAEGWEYLRAELLPSEERSGLTGSTTNWRNVLIFRRAIVQNALGETPSEGMMPPVEQEPELRADMRHEPPISSARAAAQEEETATAGDPEASPTAKPVPGPGAATMLRDNGVEEVSPVAGFTAALRQRATQRNENKS